MNTKMDVLSRCHRVLMQTPLLLVFLHLAWAANAHGVQTEYANKFITEGESRFRLGVEGVSVDNDGYMYAVGYLDQQTASLGSFATPKGDKFQKLFFMDHTGSSSFNGIRFLPISPDLASAFLKRAVVPDVLNHRLVQLLQNKDDERVRAYTFCGDDAMAQPNDAAIAPKSGRIYLSGGRYAIATTNIGDGDLWLCQAPTSFLETARDQLGQVPAQLLGHYGLTNGIEVSPDESTLYLSESFHDHGELVANKIWKFAIDDKTGGVYNRTLLVDFEELDGTQAVDIDGIRVDVDGNLFVVRNGKGDRDVVGVQKISPDGKLLLNIYLPGIKEATNLDFGGPDGKWLFVSGKCILNPVNACISVWKGNPVPGRAWAELTKSSYYPDIIMSGLNQ